MAAHFPMIATLLLFGLTGAARSDGPEQQDAQRLREENLKLREALAEQQKQLLVAEKKTLELKKQAELQARELLEEFSKLKKDSDVKAAVLFRERDVTASRLDQASIELKRLEAELAQFKKAAIPGSAEKVIAQLHKEKVELIAEKAEERKARIQSNVELRLHQSRNLELETQLRELTREIARLKAGGALFEPRKPGADNFPADYLQGRVVKVDTDGGLFTISIGSDSGLKQGHTLRVFRLAKVPAESRYLGILEVLSVREQQAVARLRGLFPVAVQPGDHVASQLEVPEKK